SAKGDNVSFLASLIVMRSGVTLLIDPGVTLYASRNANEYDAGQGLCGTLQTSSSGCRNWITLSSSSSHPAKNIGFIGPGIIDGRPPSARFITIDKNHFYTGHGMSIGSETNAGVSDILVDDLTIDGADNGLRIKSDRSRGGIVQGVSYNNVCMRNIDRRNLGGGALLFSAYYTPNAVGTAYPDYRDVRVHNTH